MALGDLSGRPNQCDRPFRGLFRVDDGSQPGGQSRAAGDAERISRRELTGCRAAGQASKVFDLIFARQFIEWRLVAPFAGALFRHVKLLVLVAFDVGAVLGDPAVAFLIRCRVAIPSSHNTEPRALAPLSAGAEPKSVSYNWRKKMSRNVRLPAASIVSFCRSRSIRSCCSGPHGRAAGSQSCV